MCKKFDEALKLTILSVIKQKSIAQLESIFSSPNVKTDIWIDGKTPLMHAAIHGFYEGALFLINRNNDNANVYLKDADGFNVRYHACQSGSTKLTIYLDNHTDLLNIAQRINRMLANGYYLAYSVEQDYFHISPLTQCLEDGFGRATNKKNGSYKLLFIGLSDECKKIKESIINKQSFSQEFSQDDYLRDVYCLEYNRDKKDFRISKYHELVSRNKEFANKKISNDGYYLMYLNVYKKKCLEFQSAFEQVNA